MASKLTYSNVVATLCLFLVLGGGAAFAAKKLIPGSKIKPNTITGKQIKNRSVGAADIKGGLPVGPTGPQGATGPAGSVASIQPEALRLVVNPGNAACASQAGVFCANLPGGSCFNWTNNTGGTQVASYFKDAAGFVHLQGSIFNNIQGQACGGTEPGAFYLPVGYRPTGGTLRFAAASSCATTVTQVDVGSDGEVDPVGGCASLDGITFRVGP